MEEVTIVGVDLAKRVFQLHGAAADGSVVFRRKLSRNQLLPFLARRPPCIIAIEACATAHHWGREIEKLGHGVRLIPPAARPTMRFVALKTEGQQARAMIFRARDLLVRQRTQLINALRGHLAEFGVVAPQGIAHVRRLQEAIDDPQAELPPVVRDIGRAYLDQITRCSGKIAEMETTLRAEAAQGEATARLQTMPGIGPIAAMAIEAFAPPMASFRRGRDFSAWLGLVPRQKSTGGKQILGKTSKMGQRDIRRLLIIGAMAVVRWATRNGALEGSWLARMLARKPRMVVAIALANKMARSAWAMLVKQENYRDPVAAAP